MKTALKLENFGGVARPGMVLDKRTVALQEEARQLGVEEGRAAAISEFDAAQKDLIARTLERLRDIELSAASARAEAEGRLRPVIEELIRAVAPVAARKGLADAVADAVAARLAAAPAQPIHLRCAPDAAGTLAEKLGDQAIIAADPMIDDGGARLEWRGGGVDYNADACARDALQALNTFFGEAGEDEGPARGPQDESPRRPIDDPPESAGSEQNPGL